MGPQTDTIKNIFIHRLIELGIEIDIIPLFMRDLRNSLGAFPSSDLKEIDRVIRQLGWDDIELDYQQTLNLQNTPYVRQTVSF